MQIHSLSPGALFRFIARYPRTIVIVSLLLAVISVLYTQQSMEYLTGRDDLMPKNRKFYLDNAAFKEEFGGPDDIVVVIESGDREQAALFGERLETALRKEQALFSDVFFPGGLPFFRKNGLLFMPLADIQALKQNLLMAQPVLQALSAAPTVQTLFTFLTGEIDAWLVGDRISPQEQERLARITFMLEKLDVGFTSFGKGGMTNLSLEGFFLRSGDKESAFAKAGKMQILTVTPVKKEGSFVPAEDAIPVVRREISVLQKLPEFKGVTVGLTGVPVLEHEEMTTSQKDITLATVVSLILTVILLLIAFRGLATMLAAMISLGVAICLSFGFATLAVGHLNILSMVFAIMLIGIGIEYGIQVVLRYKEELALGTDELAAIGQGLDRNIWAILMAAATVAAAFLTFVATDFKGISELGIIAGGGVAICVLVTFTVLPALLILLARWRARKASRSGTTKPAPDSGLPARENTKSSGFREQIKTLLFGYPKAVLVITALLCLASLYPVSQISFDYNLMNLQAKGLESVTYAYKLMRSSENSGYFAVTMANTEEETRARTKQLEALPEVDHVVSLLTFVPDQQKQKLAELAELRRALGEIKPVPYEEDLKVMELPVVFENFRNSVVKLKSALVDGKKPEAKPVGAFLATLDTFFKSLEKEKDGNAVGMLRDFQGGMFASLPEKIGLLKESLNAAPVTTADIPQELRKRFVGKTGKLALQVAPKREIFDREPLEAYLTAVRSVDPNAAGEPVMVYESMTIMRESYRSAFIYAFVAIVVILLIAFRSVTYAVIGLIPLVVGLLFMVAGMWLFGISFNSANIIVLPLILGIAVDSGIYIINRFRREDETAVEVVTRSTGLGVVYNTLTIMASFGALMLAHHQGVFSIGAVMTLGMVACQFAFILVLPAILTLVGKRP
jgi:hopanoid biosynthesis associated RND transporter like protein HpnN